MTYNPIISKLIESFKNDYTYYKSAKFNESACRLNFIDIFLSQLGWDVSNDKKIAPQYREVLVEDFDKLTGRPDYSMTLSGMVRFFVEAKKPHVDIVSSIESIFQARSYGWSAKHRIVVLTNFEFLLVYDTTVMPNVSDTHETALLAKFNYTEYLERFEEISSLISRDFVYSGEFDKCFDNNKGLQKQVDNVFLEQINNWRVKLGSYLFSKSYSIDVVNDLTQEFINQIVFLRICEDRNLPVYRKLINTIEDESVIKQELSTLIKTADSRYNSGLFKGESLIFDLNNDIIIDIIKQLYYPYSPYVFRLIDSGILGQIYEMFLVKHLVIGEHGKIELSDKKENLNRSIVTTPVEIVKYMTSKSLESLLENKTPNEVLNLRIVDIASGSGIFLVEVFEKIVEYITEWYLKNDVDHLIHMGADSYKLPYDEKRRILECCIYGVDIDIHAVEVSKFSLLLKLLEDETTPSVISTNPILPDLTTNILFGNSLIDSDLVNRYKANSQINDIVPFDWSSINSDKKFHLIIGNPPYVKSEDMKVLLPSGEVEIYKSKYKSSHKQFDKYFLFIERGLELLEENGVLCYIVPNKFSRNKAGEKLRKMLTDKSYVSEFVDFGSAQLFDDKTIYSSILLLKKKVNLDFIFREVTDLNKWWITKDDSSSSIKLSNVLLSENPWVLVADRDIAQKISNLYVNSVPLKEIATPFVGIQTSAESISIRDFKSTPAYWFYDSDVIFEDESILIFKRFDTEFSIEKSILKRYFKPVTKSEKGNSSYDICVTNKWIIFPYDHEGELIPMEVMETEYPHTLSYLKFIYSALEPKQFKNGGTRDVPNATEDSWYRYGRHQSFRNFWGTDKLIVGVMSKQPMFMRDKNNFVIASGDTAGYAGIKDKLDSPYSLEFIQAYLSHPIIETVFSILGSDFDNGFYSRGKSVMDIIPVKKINFNKPSEKAKHDLIVIKTNEVYSINERLLCQIAKKEQAVLIRRKEQLINEIFGIVSEIIG